MYYCCCTDKLRSCIAWSAGGILSNHFVGRLLLLSVNFERSRQLKNPVWMKNDKKKFGLIKLV